MQYANGIYKQEGSPEQAQFLRRRVLGPLLVNSMQSTANTARTGFSSDHNVTFVLMHYLGGSSKTWSPTVPYLMDRFKCVALDTPGFGDVSGLSGYSVQEMAIYFDQVIRCMQLKNVVLVGHSMTGKVALVMAAASPEYLRGIILVTPSPPCPQPITPADRATQLAFANQRDQAEAFVAKSHVRPLPDAWRETAVQDVLRCNPAAFHAWAGSGMDEDWSARIGEIRFPALLISGGADENVPGPDDQHRMTLSHLPFGSMAILPGMGHLLPMEAPEALAALMRNFAEALERHAPDCMA